VNILPIVMAAGFGFGQAAPAGEGTLAYNVKLEGHWQRVDCEDHDPLASCFSVDYDAALWPGLGLVTMHEDVVQSGIADDAMCEPQTRRQTLVAPAGTIRFIAEGIDCPGTQSQLGGYRAVVALARPVAGTGAYAAVRGTSPGTVHVRPDEDEVYTRFQGVLEVPSLVFDTVAPVFSGKRAAIRVQARGASIVHFALPTAADAVDGPVAVSCVPGSGARFRVGRTVVRCSANDLSGNVARVSFPVIVSRGRR
jgi:HYR domain